MESASSLAALILAAGQGKRMQSELPKVLHPCCDLPLVCHVVALAQKAGCSPIVVVVSPSTQAGIEAAVRATSGDADVRFAVQPEAHGTGDAARCGLTALQGFSGSVCILYGDVPLLTVGTLTRLREARGAAPLSLLTAQVEDPSGYGRVVRDAAGAVQKIVEHRDATASQQAIREINAGVYCVDVELLRRALAGLQRQNAQNELYLTDVVAVAAAQGGAAGVPVHDVDEVRGVNSRAELMAAEALLRARIVRAHAAAGVTVHDAAGTFIGTEVVLGRDVDLGFGVQLYGKTRVGDGVHIEGPAVLRDVNIGHGVVVHAFSHLESATLEAGVVVGPFARLRPGAHLEERARVGNFVEVKKARLGKGAKANHLAYIGDAQVGPGSNLGAGTITCNYDGFGKYQTVIGSGVFVGSNATLVAPLQLQDGAFVAAGSVITRDVEKDALALGRAPQVNKPQYAARLRERLAAQAKKNKEG